MVPTIQKLVKKIIARDEAGQPLTLLAVCPNSEAVLKAAVQAAKQADAPLLLAATLNQVDRDGGYTGWTPAQFVAKVHEFCKEMDWEGPVYPCLDHGGPWLKDRHTQEHLTLAETMAEVKKTITTCLEAGYKLLHIDPTVDRNLPAGQILPVTVILERTVELIAHAEHERARLQLPPISYEVGSEEVHGGLVDQTVFIAYLNGLREELAHANLSAIWPCFIVAQVGTDLHTTRFDRDVAQSLYKIVAPTGALIKGHYTDWVDDPRAYPACGMGAANVGPEFTSVEFEALKDLEREERLLALKDAKLSPSAFEKILMQAVVKSERWLKWRLPAESGLAFEQLPEERRSWLTQTGARYVWTDQAVQTARQQLFSNLRTKHSEPEAVVTQKICDRILKYYKEFNLVNSLAFL